MIWKRLKNLWRLSEYHPTNTLFEGDSQVLVKDFPTIKKKLAQIITEEEKDLFEEDIQND